MMLKVTFAFLFFGLFNSFGDRSLLHAEETRVNPYWNQYIQSLSHIENDIQGPCQPRRLNANAATRFQGSIVLFHGFSACPQQFFELAQALNDSGFDVYLPLNPGHGMKYSVKNEDNISLMPTTKNWEMFENFSNKMFEVAHYSRRFGGKISVGGISVGGAIALHMLLIDPDLFSSAILYAPQIELEDIQGRLIGLPLAMIVDAWGEKDFSWGPGCFLEERQKGRGGICNFKAKNMASAQLFTNEIVRNLRPLPLSTQVKVQFLGVERDVVVSNHKNFEVLKKLGENEGPLSSVSACLYPHGTNHSMLSRFDSPKEDKFWVNGLIKQSVAFINRGTPFKVAHKSTVEPGPFYNEKMYDVCAVNP